MTLNKVARDVVQAFKKAGIEIEVPQKSKHYLVYHHGKLVYKFGQGTKAPVWATAALNQVIRDLKNEDTRLGEISTKSENVIADRALDRYAPG